MKGLFIPDITAEMFRNGCLEGIEALMAEGEIYDIDYEPEPHWIPVTERLPEENQICIVTDETMKNTYEYRFCKETYDEIQGWTYLRHRIIAWMPLPEPYEEGKE